MSEALSGRWCSLKVHAMGKCYEELPMGPTIMVSHPQRVWSPPTDVFECEGSYVIKLAISGLRRDASGNIENAEIRVERDTIIIRGHRTDDCPDMRCSFHQFEIHYGDFECRVEIHDAFDRNAIEAEYREGYLIVTVPKLGKEQDLPRRIQVTD